MNAAGTAPRFNIDPISLIAAVGLLIYPLVATPFFTYQVGGYSLILGTIALSLTVLAGYGGMVSLAQMSVAGVAGYMVAILGQNSAGARARLAVVDRRAAGARRSACSSAVGIGLLAIRTAGIYTIMITLAIGMAFFLFVQQNYAIFNGHSGFAGHRAAGALRRQLARSGAVLLSGAGRRGALLRRRRSTARARPSASLCRRSATIRAACVRSASTSRRTAWPPMPWPGRSHRSPACCSSGSTGASRPARSASTG